MTGDALARAEANFAAGKELCRTGHEVCTYGGMTAAGGYWLADEDCPLNHGETCDLQAVCDGAEATTGFRGSEPDPGIAYWVWRVTACQPCAEVYVAAHPEWRREDPDAPKPGYDEVMARLHEQVEADRAAMTPAQREYSDMATNMLLYGQHPAPDPTPEPQFTGFAGLFDDAIVLEPAVKPQRDRAPDAPATGPLSADALDRGPVSHPLDQLANHMGAHCTCMLFFPTDPWTATLMLSRVPQHPSVYEPVLRLRGAYCAHPQLAGWRLFELPLSQRILVFPWPPALTDRELGEFLRREAARSTGHDVGLIAIDMPDRDCLRHRPAPREVAPR